MKEDVRFTFAKQYTLNMKQESGIILNSHCAIKMFITSKHLWLRGLKL